MKKFFTYFVAVLAIAAAAAGPVRGQTSQTSTLNFTAAYGSGPATADDNVQWTVTSDGAESNFNMDRGIHYGTGSATVGYIELSTSGITGTITQVVVNASTASSVNNATVSVTVGGNAFGTTQSMSNNNTTDYTFTGSASGAIVVRVAKPSAATGALYVMSIEVTYTPAPPVPHTVRFASGNDGWTVQDVTASSSATAPAVLENVVAGDSLVATYSGTRKVKSVKAVKYVDPITVPLTMEALTAGNIEVNISGNFSTGMKYSVNGGAKTLINTTTTIDVAAGDKVQFYGNGTSTQAYGDEPQVKLRGTAQTKVYGNIMSLLDEDNFATATTLSGDNVFYGLFKNNPNLTDASGLLLPATTLTNNCYRQMFSNCSTLVAAPELPATTLAYNCYRQMFYGCSSLTAAPALPATTLAEACYYQMFYNCSTLVAAPELPATTLAQQCYSSMFFGCSALIAAPALPATTLAKQCYSSMFANDSSLTAAPALPATTLAQSCYYNMFKNCTGLTTAPALPATTLAQQCYYSMFQNCTGLTAAPVLPAETMANYCYNNMFNGCSKLSSVTCLATTLVNNGTTNWLTDAGTDESVTSRTFTAPASTDWPSGNNGIPSGWTRVNLNE